MDTQLFEQKLEALKNSLEGRTSEQVKEAVKAFEDKLDASSRKAFEELSGEMKREQESKVAEIENGLKEIKEYAAKLDAKMSAPKVEGKHQSGFEAKMAQFIADNSEKILKSRKGAEFGAHELKVVGDMTTANLTGDEERAHSREVAVVPGRLVHFVDLCGPDINIGLGTYTFPRETGTEGAIAQQTEGVAKSQIDYDFTHIDVATEFIAGFAVYSKKMANNIPFLTSFLPGALRRDYMNAEDGIFEAALSAAATAATAIITGGNKSEMLIDGFAQLAAANYSPNGIVVTPADYFDMLLIEKSTGAGYGLPYGFSVSNDGLVRVLGVPLVWANWMTANEYYIGDWSTVNRVVTEGLSLEFSGEDVDNFRKNNITARIEAQVGLAIHRPDSILFRGGGF